MLTADAVSAEELLQDTHAAIYAKWGLVAAAAAPRAYVRRALVNRYVSQQRRARPLLFGLGPGPVALIPDVGETEGVL